MTALYRQRPTQRATGPRQLLTHEWHTREIFSKQTQIRVYAKRDALDFQGNLMWRRRKSIKKRRPFPGGAREVLRLHWLPTGAV